MPDPQQRQRVMMVFGKQSPNENVDRTSTVSTRSYHVSMKPDETPVNNENSSSTISKLLPIQPDSMSINLTTRYDLSVLNRSPLVVKVYSIVFNFRTMFRMFREEEV